MAAFLNRHKAKLLLGAVLCAVLGAALLATYTRLAPVTLPTPKAKPLGDAVTERVLGTGFLQCGLTALPPLVNLDGSTVLDSTLTQVLQSIASTAGLRLTFTALAAGGRDHALQNSIVDADCFASAHSGALLQRYSTGRPVLTIPYTLYVAAARGAQPVRPITADSVAALAQGSVGESWCLHDLPQLSGQIMWFSRGLEMQALQAVAEQRADLTVSNPLLVAAFNRDNPDQQLMPLVGAPEQPVPYYILLPHGATVLRTVLDDAIRHFQDAATLQGSTPADLQAQLDSFLQQQKRLANHP